MIRLENKIVHNLFVKGTAGRKEEIQNLLSLNKKFFSKPMNDFLNKVRERYSSSLSLEEDVFVDIDENYFSDLMDIEDTKGTLTEYINELKLKYFSKELKNIDINEGKEKMLGKLEIIREELLGEETQFKPISLKKCTLNFYNNLEKQRTVQPLKTGWPKFDKYIQAVPGDMVVIAGRPGQGKTAFSLNLALQMAKQGKRGLFISLEMSEGSIINRLMAIESGLSSSKLRNIEQYNSLSNVEMSLVNEASENLTKLDENLNIISGSMNSNQLKALCFSTKGQYDFIMLDYIGLVRPSSRISDRYQVVTEVSLLCKEIAMHCDIPVFVLSQLSREVEKRADKRPVMSDLRESGQIEQDASIIIGLFRESYYDIDANDKELMEVHLLKNREGETGCINYNFVGFNQRVKERA